MIIAPLSNLDNFIYYFCLIAVARASNTMLNRSSKSGHPFLVYEFQGKAFHCWGLHWLWVCHKWSLLYRHMFLLHILWHEFYYKYSYWSLSNAFSESIEMTLWLLSFLFLNVVYYIDWFAYVELSLWLWNESNLIIVYNPFIYCGIPFANILLRSFTSIFSKIIDL